MNIGRLDDGLIRGLPKVGTCLIELFTLGAVVESVNSRAVGSLLGCVTEQTQDELFDLKREGGVLMFFGMCIGNNYFFPVVRNDASFGDRAAPDIAPDIL